jgi:Subtilase family
MRWRFVIGLFIFLTGCSTKPIMQSDDSFFETAATYRVAWGERIKLEPGTASIKVTYLGTLTTFAPSSSTFDIPPPNGAPDLSMSSSVSRSAYATALDSTSYVNRGTVQLLNNKGKTIKSYTPYGSVEAGRLTVLASITQSCSGFFNTVISKANEGNPSNGQFVRSEAITEALLSTSPTIRLCYATLETNQQGTQPATKDLEAALRLYGNYTTDVSSSGFVVDRNDMSSLDPPPRSFDPSCDQIKKWLDPIGDTGYLNLDMTTLKTDTNTLNATATGSGVTVFVVGSGLGANDTFACGTQFDDHDNHIGNIIQSLAPVTTITGVKACDSSGTCPAATLGKAFLSIINTVRLNPSEDYLINASWGGPLLNQSGYSLFNILGNRFDVMIVASGGNGPNAPAHYPASFDKDVAASPALALENVISVAALGKKATGYAIAGFNTRKNASIFAPGVDLCPPTATSFRCDSSQSYPDDLGITGSSFSVAPVTAVAALYLDDAPQATPLTPATLRRCLRNSAGANKVFSGLVRFDAAACP